MIEPNDFTKQALQNAIKTGAEVINFQLLDVAYDDREQFYYFVDLAYKDTILYTKHFLYRSNNVNIIDIANDVNNQIDHFNNTISFGTIEELYNFIICSIDNGSCCFFNYILDGQNDIFKVSDSDNFYSVLDAYFHDIVEHSNNGNLLDIYSKFFESLEKVVLKPAINDYIKEYF